MRIAFKMFWYPVHRQVFPAMALRICCSVGLLLLFSRCTVESSSPGVQKPHCSPWHSANACWTGCNSPFLESPSTVMISPPSAIGANSVQDFVVRPFNRTVQAPQYVVSQPICVPVRLKCSRSNSTSRVRGSTSASRGSPLTRTRTRMFSASNIFVPRLNVFPVRPPHRDSYGPLDESGDQNAFVIRGAPHVVLRFSGRARRFDGAFNPLLLEFLPPQSFLRLFCANRGQSNAAKYNPHILASVAVSERELHRRASRRIDGSAALERQIGSPAILHRLSDNNLADQFVVSENRRIGILEKIIERDGSLSRRPGASHRRVQGKQDRAPISARVRFRKRSADRPLIAHLHVRDARRAIVNDGNGRSGVRCIDVRVTRQSPESQLAVAAPDFTQPRNEIDIHQRAGTRHSHLHQRDEALPAGNQPRLLAQLLQEFGRLQNRPGAMIRKRMRVHDVFRLPLGMASVRSWTAAKINGCSAGAFYCEWSGEARRNACFASR